MREGLSCSCSSCSTTADYCLTTKVIWNRCRFNLICRAINHNGSAAVTQLFPKDWQGWQTETKIQHSCSKVNQPPLLISAFGLPFLYSCIFKYNQANKAKIFWPFLLQTYQAMLICINSISLLTKPFIRFSIILSEAGLHVNGLYVDIFLLVLP